MTNRPHADALAFLLLILSFGSGSASAQHVDFVRDVRPILQEHCYACHGPEKQKSSLRLDIKSEAFQGGEAFGPSIVAGNAADSPLVRFVADRGAELEMPPDAERLAAAEVATLVRWVEEGAVWPDGVDLAQVEDRLDHWSFKEIKRPRPPATRDEQWPRCDVDRFILDQLERASLRPSPEADRIAWQRRVAFDLTGLPPTPDQVSAFLSDPSDEAYERVVDALLGSPRYGERWGRHWLDVVRYADTDGFEVNTPRPNAWPYRDYVIEAFNNDTPYDEFIREQLAGDALGRDAATGFLVTAAALLPGQIGQDDASKRLARQDALGEIVINVSEAFLGLSVGCARCHDHKFDPISQTDYYAMQAFFSGVHYGERPLGNADGEDAPKVFAGVFTMPEPTRLLLRGDPEQPLERLAPAVPAALGDVRLSDETAEQERRLKFAQWLVSADNPLTARVIVNRIWQGHFGRGLVDTASDFGRSGSRPTHPDLLDWLATEFLRSGWSIKHMHRLLVLSAAYRQSSQVDAHAQTVDADARLLWRFPGRRLEAEAIRDAMLTVSGRLNLQMGGPGFDLFQSRGGLSGFPPVEAFDDKGRRRMVYAHNIRMEREAVFGAFDCPDGGQSTARRSQSTTPIQALNLFNSQFTIDEAAAFAARATGEAGPEVAAQIDRAFQLAFARSPDAQEMDECEKVVAEFGLATLCRAIYNSNEFLFLP